jgi:predicted lipoprotein with Yx(FWY)xxD motif
MTTTLRIRPFLGAAAALAVTLALAACGSSSGSSSASQAAASSPASAGGAHASGAAAISMTTGSLGSYLTGASGRAIYLWDGDHGTRSDCSGACAQAWPPVTVTGAPHAAHGVTASELGTTTRADGAKQVTYHGHPLYYFVADPAAGTTKGQGSDNFGAKWWLVAPSGAPLTKAAPAAGSSSSSAGAHGSGY